MSSSVPKKPWGSVLRKGKSPYWYIKFNYLGVPVCLTTGYVATEDNLKKVRAFLAKVKKQIDEGNFAFCEEFPYAPQAMKTKIARRENLAYVPSPEELTIEDHFRDWKNRVLDTMVADDKKKQYLQAIDRLMPHLGPLTFWQLTAPRLAEIMKSLRCLSGPKQGEPLSRRRIFNLLTVFHLMWNDARMSYRWTLPDPCTGLARYLPRSNAKPRKGFRFATWLQVWEFLSDWARPIAELMLLTGMIYSELCTLKKSNIHDGYIHIKEGKTANRRRQIPITQAIKRCLDVLMARSEGPWVVSGIKNAQFSGSTFTKHLNRALEACGLSSYSSYSLRHSFAAWSLAIKVDMNRLVSLMGHSDKRMVYEVYGKYIPGIERDAVQILGFFGADFVDAELMFAKASDQRATDMLKLTELCRHAPILATPPADPGQPASAEPSQDLVQHDACHGGSSEKPHAAQRPAQGPRQPVSPRPRHKNCA